MTKIIEPNKQSNIFKRPSSETGIWSWITTVDHKRIGIMYGYAAFFFLLIGGLEALILRIQLSQPDNNFLTAAEYNAMFTICLLYTSPSPRDFQVSRMPSSA